MEVIRFLLERGADSEVRNRKGEREGMSSLEAVERSKNESVSEIVLGQARSADGA